MKKIFKGCLVLILLLILTLTILYLFFPSKNSYSKDIEYIKTPKDIEYFNKGYDYFFNKIDIPKTVINQNKSNIVYQAFIANEDFTRVDLTYIVVYKLNNDINLDNKLPIRNEQKIMIEDERLLYDFENGFNPMIETPKDNKIKGVGRVVIYQDNIDLYLNMKKGSYYYKNHNKESIQDVIIFDKKSKLLYYIREGCQGNC